MRVLLLGLGLMGCGEAPEGEDPAGPTDADGDSLCAPGDGCTAPVTSVRAKLLAEGEGDKAGYSMAGLGDMDADGLADVLVGARFSGEAGVAYVVGGPAAGTTSLSASKATLHGEALLDEFGGRVASAGDLDEDGTVDLLIGAPGLDIAGVDSGGVYVFFGPVVGDVPAADAVGFFWGETAGDRAGDSLANVGDVDGDGRSDLAVGASNGSFGGTRSGGVYLLLGPTTGTVSLADAHARLAGPAAYDTAGNTVAPLGDTNGDGFADFAIGAPHREPLGTLTPGASFVVLGPVAGDLSLADADAILYGEHDNACSGGDLGGGSDINGDGFADLAVGSHSWGEGEIGAAYLVWGPVSGTIALGDAPVRFTGEAPGDWLGVRLDFVGDLDGNGHVDLGVGARTNSEVAEDAGAAYACLGPFEPGSHEVADCGLRLLGEAGLDLFGMDIAPAGDLTGDGLDDMLVGAAGEGTMGVDAGAAYVISLGG